MDKISSSAKKDGLHILKDTKDEEEGKQDHPEGKGIATADAVEMQEQDPRARGYLIRNKATALLEHAPEGTNDHDLYWNRLMSINASSMDELFETFERDENGKISEIELKERLIQLGADRCSPVAMEEYMHALDTDMTGYISREEFETFIEAARDLLFPVELDEDFSEYDIFLGGSCNPTTWRKELAIPMLKSKGVTYYNPQVDHWSEALIAVEQKAKIEALVLLYVIDRATRALASMIEVAELITDGRNVIVVIQDVEEGDTINDEEISPSQLKDLNRCRAYLADVVKRRGRHETSIVYKNIAKATLSTVCLVERIKAERHQKAEKHFPEDNLLDRSKSHSLLPIKEADEEVAAEEEDTSTQLARTMSAVETTRSNSAS